MNYTKTKREPAILVFTDSVIVSTDALVLPDTAAALFGIKRSSLDRNWRQITARHGLQRVQTGGTYKYRLKSIQEVIKRCAELDEPLYETGNSTASPLYCKLK